MKRPLITLLLPFLLLLASCGQGEKTDNNQSVEKRTVTNGDVLINHKTSGEGPLTLLFVHGWCIDQEYWSNQVESLSSTYKVVTVDLPGFGKSGNNRNDWTTETYATDINAVIDQLELDNVVLIGHSMGGGIVLEVALNNDNIVALIGVDNFKDIGMEFTDDIRAETNGFISMLGENFSQIAPVYAESALFHPSTDSTVRARVMKNFSESDSVVAVSSLAARFEYAEREAGRLSELKQKLYLINSDATPTNIEGLDATGANYELISIEATGHYPMIEKPDLFNQLLSTALEKIVSKR